MSTNYPGTGIDSFPTHATGDVIQASYDNNEQDAIVALETKVGVNGSAVSSTHDYKLSGVTGSDKAVSKTGTETLTNKTLSTGSKVLVGSDATGDIYYNGGSGTITRLAVGSAGQVLTIAAGVPSYATPTAVVNGSTSVAGVYQEATVAEINAGTATGSTGARLVTNPSTINKATLTAGEGLTAGNALHLTPYYQSDGGVTLDFNSATAYNDTTNQTKSITVANNSNRVLLVGVGAGSTPSSVTFNGTSMTLVDSQALAVGFSFFVYKLVAPTATTANISVTATIIGSIAAASYYNVDQTTYVEASAKALATTVNITTLTAGSFIHFFGGRAHTTGTDTTNVSTYTSKYSSSITASTSNGYGTGSTSTVSVVGGKFNETITSTCACAITGGAGTTADAVIAVSLKPATAMAIGVVKANTSAITSNEPLIDFIGFADSSVSLGASVNVTHSGVVNGLSGLTAGKNYYLQDSAGTIGTTRGAYGKVIGKALSATTLLIAPNKTLGAAIAKTAGYTYTAECDGLIVGQTSSTSATVTIAGDSSNISPQVGTTANYSTPGTYTVSRGNTYLFTVSGASQNLKFIPMA